MQDEVEQQTVTLIVHGAQFSGRVLKSAISKYLTFCKEKKMQKVRNSPVAPHGKQTVKQLIGQNQGVSNMEINDAGIRDFERIARKYGVDYAVRTEKHSIPPKHLIFFKARDADALTAAFSEYTANQIRRANRPSVLAQLTRFAEQVKSKVTERIKHKELER